MHGTVGVAATREDKLIMFDLSDPAAPRATGQIDLHGGYHEDVAIDDDRILVGWHTRGAPLYDRSGALIATLPADDAFAVALHGDRAAITDDATLILFDISEDPPTELDRAELLGEGRDLAFEGAHLAVGMGGDGTAIFQVTDDQLHLRGNISPPGASMSVAIDGDDLWIGAWKTTALVRLGEDPPVVSGHESPQKSAMGVGAVGGRAMVADWTQATSLQAHPGLSGPEIVIDERLFVDESGAPVGFIVRNDGSHPLTVGLEVSGRYTIDHSTLRLEPNDRQTVWMQPDEPGDLGNGTIAWTSDDPDELSGEISIEVARSTIGTPHPDFELLGFTWPDTATQTWRLADQRGRLTYLVYFALF